MAAARARRIERQILTLVESQSDELGYPTSLPALGPFFREFEPIVSNREVVDALKRLRPQYLPLWKWSEERGATFSIRTRLQVMKSSSIGAILGYAVRLKQDRGWKNFSRQQETK